VVAPASRARCRSAAVAGHGADQRRRLHDALAIVNDRFAFALLDMPPRIGLCPGLALPSADAGDATTARLRAFWLAALGPGATASAPIDEASSRVGRSRRRHVLDDDLADTAADDTAGLR